MYKRKLHKEISSGLLALIVAFSLTGCGSSRDALEISDTESAQAEGISQETATATPATSQIIPETTTEPEPEKITYQTGLYQEKTLADQVSVDAARELPEGEYGVLSYSYLGQRCRRLSGDPRRRPGIQGGDSLAKYVFGTTCGRSRRL